MDTTLDHLKAKEIGRHRLRVAEIKRRAHQWRLTDCTEASLVQMRHALISEMEELENDLSDANDRFLLYVENGQPISTEKELQKIDQLAREWEALNTHLQDVDDALLERHLNTSLIRLLGSRRRLILLDAIVFWSIILIVVLTIIELLVPLPPQYVTIITVVDTVISLFLIADFSLRLYLCEDNSWYFRRYWIDLLAAIPFNLLSVGPLVSVARFARLFRLLRLGRAFRVLVVNFRGLDKLFETLQINLLKRALFIATALLFVGALSLNRLENSANIGGLGESLWWSFTTVVTGGFADLYNPVTIYGRLLTVGLVLLGLTVTGIFTASLTSVLVEDESSRLEQQQAVLENQLGILDQKLDLLSGETNQGLIAMETVSQQLSNRRTRFEIAEVLASTMVEDYNCIQASIHLLTPARDALQRITWLGLENATPPERVAVGTGFTGRVTAVLLATHNLAETDLEPETEPRPAVRGLAMICPLVAGQQVLGVLHVVLPEDLGRFYLYNRVPMTLAHHAAIAFYAAELATE